VRGDLVHRLHLLNAYSRRLTSSAGTSWTADEDFMQAPAPNPPPFPLPPLPITCIAESSPHFFSATSFSPLPQLLPAAAALDASITQALQLSPLSSRQVALIITGSGPGKEQFRAAAAAAALVNVSIHLVWLADEVSFIARDIACVTRVLLILCLGLPSVSLLL
jgi:hypothetical protein